MTIASQADPSTIDDEAFLLFLADTIENDGELIDPLTMDASTIDLSDSPSNEEQEEEHE